MGESTTHAPRSVSTDVCGWSFAALPSPRTLGCWPVRELDDALGLTETASECLQESRAVVTLSTDWWAFSGSRCTVVWRATRIPTTLNGWPRTRRCG